MTRKRGRDGQSELMALLPWRAAEALDPERMRRVDAALAADPELAAAYAAIRAERAAIAELHEGLGAPSPRARERLFAAIDAEPRRPAGRARPVTDFVASLSPRTLTAIAASAAVLLAAQSAVIAAMPFTAAPQPGAAASLAPAALGATEPAARAPRRPGPALAAVRFAPDARYADIAALLKRYDVAIAGTAKGGWVKLRAASRNARYNARALAQRLRGEVLVAEAAAE